MKSFISVLFSIQLLFANQLFFVDFKNNESTIIAKYDNVEQDEIDLKAQFSYQGESTINEFSKSLVEKIENYLYTSGTSVVNEIEKLICFYESKQSELSYHTLKESKSINNSIICTFEHMIEDFTYCKHFNEQKDEENCSKEIIERSYLVNGHMTDEELGVYTSVMSAHTAIVAYFSNQNYYLAAELLTHMRDNNEIDSIYRPINSYVVTQSETFTNLAYENDFRGTGIFNPNNSVTAAQDLYLSIHSFYYSKSIHNDAIVLTDRYDFEFDTKYDDFLTDTASNLMFTGQNYGFLKPFFTTIEASNATSINQNSRYINLPFIDSNDWRYKDYSITLGEDDWIYLCFSFENSGVWTIQTFGDKDTEIYLYSGDGSGLLYCSDDDNGFEYNSLVSFDFFSGVLYIYY